LAGLNRTGLTEKQPVHLRREMQSLQMHRKIAAMMERDPKAVIEKALRN
jgi:hypothetical protein